MKISLDGHSPAVLHLTQHDEPGGIRLELGGELDLSTADHLTDTCQQLPLPPGALLRLDLAGLQFLDAAGLHALLRVHQAATDRGHRMQVHRPRPLARRILALTALDTVLDVLDVHEVHDVSGQPSPNGHRRPVNP